MKGVKTVLFVNEFTANLPITTLIKLLSSFINKTEKTSPCISGL
jgi:hypothetical protein